MLVVLRGNSGSGKSAIAAALQQALGWPTAILSQDHFRRIVYREREQESLAHADLLEVAAAHCLRAGHHVILEGIFNAERYSTMLECVAAQSNDARFFARPIADPLAGGHGITARSVPARQDKSASVRFLWLSQSCRS